MMDLRIALFWEVRGSGMTEVSERFRVVQPVVRGGSCGGARIYLGIIIFIVIQCYKMLLAIKNCLCKCV